MQQELVPEVLRIGVIGLGRAGAMMLAAMARHRQVHLTAAADLHRQHLDRFQEDFGGLAFSDAEALCASPEVDVVHIATPHEYHAEHTHARRKPWKTCAGGKADGARGL